MFLTKKGYLPMTKKTPAYRDESAEHLVGEESSRSSSSEEFVVQEKRSMSTILPGRKGRIFFFLNVGLFCVSLVVFGASYSYTYRMRNNVNNALLKGTNYYSPLLNNVNIPLYDVRVNGSLLDMDGSIYRAPPSPEVDAAWNRVADLRPTWITTEDVIKLGKDPSRTARYPDDFGLGPDKHIAELDVLHQIHCLNAIRRDLDFEYYFRAKYPDGQFPELHRVHTSHCLYIILQHLMCTASTDIVTQAWVEGQTHPFPDFSINRKCRDFNAILEWQDKNVVDLDKFKALRKPEGHVPSRMSEEFKRMFGVEDWDGRDHDHGHAGAAAATGTGAAAGGHGEHGEHAGHS
ncbi:uncharacterized protein LAJ45_05170 [Morchella importuna]|uniref:uncharacterized protein n=1 Tax=Morchella importuna TaxID=1174673 RepID=UPI001E8DD407|nr:uncharacterized protein LAJ45_05170 [Morchella importuna]KAH8150987.1 hypothetical protein LAJ45_05170 [Morchella importuna]